MRTLCILAAAVLLLAACQAPPDRSFSQVHQEVAAREGAHAVWNRGDAPVVAAQDKLLDSELSADDAVQLALLRNPSLQAEYEELGIAQADLVQAGLLKNPVFSASIRFPARPHYAVDLGIEEEFVDLLFLPARKKNAELSLNQTQLKVADHIVAMAAEVRKSWVRAVGLHQMAATKRIERDAAQAAFDAAKDLRDAGNLTDAEVDDHEAELTQAQMSAEDAELAAAEAREELARMLAVDAGKLRLPEKLPDVGAAMEEEAALEKNAAAQRLDIRIAGAQVGLLREQLGMARFAALLSGGSVGAEMVRDPDVKTTIGPTLAIPIPIFDQGQSAVDRGGAEVRQAVARAAALRLEAASQVRIAAGRVAAARARLMYLQTNVTPLRERQIDEALRRYNGMFISVFELLAAKQAALGTQENAVQALQRYWEARAELERAVGGKLPLAPTATTTTQGGAK